MLILFILGIYAIFGVFILRFNIKGSYLAWFGGFSMILCNFIWLVVSVLFHSAVFTRILVLFLHFVLRVFCSPCSTLTGLMVVVDVVSNASALVVSIGVFLWIRFF